MKWLSVLFPMLFAGAAPTVAAKTPDLATMPSVREGVAVVRDRLVRDGVSIDFEARASEGEVLMEDRPADIQFTLKDAANNQPIPGLTPGVWLDLGQVLAGRDGEQKDCKEKIALYLKGVVGIRPMLDLNGYYLFVLNKDSSITVVDPIVSFGGATSTYGVIVLKRPGIDWVRSRDGKTIFASMPSIGQVAVIDALKLKVLQDLDAGVEPVRVAVQPDGRYLWVGNNARKPDESGVTVIDTQTMKRVGFIATGAGHHEIAFESNSRYAFVSNRDSGTVTVIDVSTLKAERTMSVGARPIALAYSGLAKALYVAEASAGVLTAYDGETLAPRKRLKLRPGLGPLRLSPDGRFVFQVNTAANTVSIIDAASDEMIHEINVAGEPYQVTFTRGFAYIRSLSSERVTMVNLGSVGPGREPIVQSFAAGALAPRLAGDLPIADGVTAANDDAGVFVINPSDNTTYFYMEGMNAPMTNYINRGHSGRAAMVVDRAIKEVEPGVFSTRVRFPAAGKYDVAFMLEQPRILHCFSAEVVSNPETERQHATVKAAFGLPPQPIVPKSTVPVRVTLTRGRDNLPVTGIADLSFKYFRAPTSRALQIVTREVEDGVYEADIRFDQVGAYYVHVVAPSLKDAANQLPFASVRVGPSRATESTSSAKEGTGK